MWDSITVSQGRQMLRRCPRPIERKPEGGDAPRALRVELAPMNLNPDRSRLGTGELRSEPIRYELHFATLIMKHVRRNEFREQWKVFLSTADLNSSGIRNLDGPILINRVDLAGQSPAVGRINEAAFASDARRRPAHQKTGRQEPHFDSVSVRAYRERRKLSLRSLERRKSFEDAP